VISILGGNKLQFFDAETGEISKFKLTNGDGESERFYRSLEAPVLVGVEASGNTQ
jgi:hypothetical protein